MVAPQTSFFIVWLRGFSYVRVQPMDAPEALDFVFLGLAGGTMQVLIVTLYGALPGPRVQSVSNLHALAA